MVDTALLAKNIMLSKGTALEVMVSVNPATIKDILAPQMSGNRLTAIL